MNLSIEIALAIFAKKEILALGQPGLYDPRKLIARWHRSTLHSVKG
jgi:hypothetical protein